jgi:hypothetical protein
MNQDLWEWEYLCEDTYRLKVDNGYIYRYHNSLIIFVKTKKPYTK